MMDAIVTKVNCVIRLIAVGDNAALGRHFELTSGYLKNMAFGYVSDKTLTDDVVLETYLKVVRYAKSFNPKQKG